MSQTGQVLLITGGFLIGYGAADVVVSNGWTFLLGLLGVALIAVASVKGKR